MKRILICEDDAAVATILVRTLTREGFEVTAIGHAADALAKMVETGPPDLLISDLMLPPPMSGAELASQMLARHPALPVIAITGYLPDDMTHQTLKELDVLVLQKPVARQKLIDTVRALLDRAT